jgi:hypothetical protein
MPAVTLVHPPVRNPALVRVWALPMTRYPLMSFATPSPIPAEPDIADGGRWTVFLNSGRGRSRVHHGAYVIAMRGWDGDDASAEQAR